MKKISLQLLMFICFSAFSMSVLAQKTVTGVVSNDLGELLPGATVLVKGTSNGVVTDFDGIFSISVSNNDAILVVSFIGTETQEVPVGNQTNIEITLKSSSEVMDEVVVTALGLSREKKSLGYSVGEVASEELVRAPSENVLNSIAGKVSGVAVSSTGAAGSSVSIVIRGASSLTTDNQPLFVIDGIPVFNTLNNVGGVGDRNVVDYGNAISDLNPDDIESMTILKGASAAALYGSRAGNGVVIITTKSGKRSKGMGVTINSSTVFDIPYKYFQKHNLMANGSRPYTPDNMPTNAFGQLIVNETSDGFVGPELDQGYLAIQWPFTDAELSSGIPVARPLESHKYNPNNFFQTQVTSINNISIEDNSEKLNYRLSYNNMINKGFIPNSDLRRNSISLNSAYKLSDKLKVTSSLNFTKTASGNRPAGNRGTNPMQAAYNINSHIDIRNLRDYWLPGFEGEKQNAPYTWGKPNDINFNNPYFMAYEINNGFVRNRIYGNVKFDYKLSDEWNLMARYNYDEVNEVRETKMSKGYLRDPRGAYGLQSLIRQESNLEFLLSYNKTIDNWSFSGSFGGNMLKVGSRNVSNKTKNGGSGLILPNVFTLQNIAPDNLLYSSSTSKRSINSLYVLGNIGYKDIAYLDVTGRNDWSSTLPVGDNSFFYPSVSTSVLLNNIWDLGSNVSLIKLRAGWAQVGNDTGPYALNTVLSAGGTWGNALQLSQPGGLLNPNLQSELNTSIEFGGDLSFFQNRLRFDATYYESENENQILGVGLPPSSGYTSRLINAGLLSSKGIEAGLGITAVKSENWNWDMNFVYSRNRTKIVELTEGIDFYQLWRDAKGGAVTWVGEEIGNIIDRAIVRVDDPNSQYDGWLLLDDEGWEQDDRTWQDSDGKRVAPIIGNFNPDFNLGLITSVTYKNWKLAMTFDWRKGGQFVSQTHRYNESDLQTQRWIDKTYDLNNVGDIPTYILANADTFIYENSDIQKFYPEVGGPTAGTGGLPFTGGDNVTLNDGTFIPGVIGDYDDDGNFIATQENIGGPGTQLHDYGDSYPWSFTAASTFNADFVKLRDIALSYMVPTNLARRAGLQNATVSLYSRNIILWTAAGINIDPENAFQPDGGGFKQGIERYNINPWAIPIGVKLNISF